MRPGRIWYDPPHVRWGRVAVTVLIASVLFGLWVAQRRGLFDPAPERVVSALSPVAGAIAASGVARHEAAASDPLALAAPAPAKAASSVELYCGVEAVSVDPGDEAAFKRAVDAAEEKLQAHRARVLPGWLEEMKSSADEQVQAAAWFMEATREGFKRLETGSTTLPFDSLDELAKLAQRSRDPLPYAWAYQACEMLRRQNANTACDGLTVQDWAQRDPGNAFPWLVAAGQSGLEAARRSDYVEKALAADAMHSSWGQVHAVLVKAAPASEAPLDRSVRFIAAFDLDAFISAAQSNLIGHCSEIELRQGVRRQQCEQLAAFLTDKGDTLLAQSSGSAIGKRLGWSQDRVSRLQSERDSLFGAQIGEIAAGGCAGLARAEAYFADVARYGEIGALRRHQQPTANAAGAAAR